MGRGREGRVGSYVLGAEWPPHAPTPASCQSRYLRIILSKARICTYLRLIESSAAARQVEPILVTPISSSIAALDLNLPPHGWDDDRGERDTACCWPVALAREKPPALLALFRG
jgi:hypothetical protein